MFADEFLEKYLQGQRIFTNDIITGGSLSDHNLTGLQLTQVQFSNVDLTGAILDDAVLQRVSFVGGSLAGISLQRAKVAEMGWRDRVLDRANLAGADLSHAQLQDCSLRDANLFHANCSAANLRGAALQGADLREAIFEQANLAEVQADERTQWPEAGAFRSVQLSAGTAVAKLTRRRTAQGAGNPAQVSTYIPIPGANNVSIEKVHLAILRDWRTRAEQPAFRREVFTQYQGRCAISEQSCILLPSYLLSERR